MNTFTKTEVFLSVFVQKRSSVNVACVPEVVWNTGYVNGALENNEMIANPEKFHAILLRKNQTNTSGEPIDHFDN